MNIRSLSFVIAWLAVLFGSSAPTWAVPINFEVTGTIDTADTGNPFNLSDGDIISLMAMFDDDLIAGSGQSLIEFGESGNAFGSTLTITAGSITLTQTDDVDPTNIFPTISFIDGSFDFVDFRTNDSLPDFSISSSGVIGGDGIGGNINVASASITPRAASVPEPGTLALLGLGFVSLISRRRRG